MWQKRKWLTEATVRGQSLPGHDLDFEIADDIKEQFNELNSKGIDVNELLREMLKKRQERIAETKEEIAKTIQPTTSGYISTKIQNILKRRTRQKMFNHYMQKTRNGNSPHTEV